MAHAVIFCTGCKRHMHRAKKLCKEVQKDSANQRKYRQENAKEKREICQICTKHLRNNMIKFTKINFLLNFHAAAWAFGTAIASILVKTLHPKKDVGNFFGRIAPKGTATHTWLLIVAEGGFLFRKGRLRAVSKEKKMGIERRKSKWIFLH